VARLRQDHVRDRRGAACEARRVRIARAVAVVELLPRKKELPGLLVVRGEAARLDARLREILVVELDQRVVPVVRGAAEPLGAVDRRVELTRVAIDVVEQRLLLLALLHHRHLEIVAQQRTHDRTAQPGSDDDNPLLHFGCM
jgi:hypothetical protein